jgi:glycosyltransferase involved in cell wall biosynthesis
VILAPGVGGVSRHVFDPADGLRALGHRPEIFCREDAVTVQRAARSRELQWRSLRQAPRSGADVWHLHVHNPLDTRALPLLAARRLFGRSRLVMTEHLPRHPRTDFVVPDNVPQGGRWRFRKPGAKWAKLTMKQLQYRLCDAVIAVSASSNEFLRARYGLPADKVITVFNGVDVPPDPPPPAGNGHMRVMAIGELHWRKGFDILLDACALARTDWSLIVIGDGASRAELEDRANRLGARRNVLFEGHRADASTAPLEGDVVCVPSRAESFSYVILEAMAAGRPVVASNVDGARDAITDGSEGLLVPAEQPERLAEALDRLAIDPDLRISLGRRAHARARERFTTGRMVDAILGVYVDR